MEGTNAAESNFTGSDADATMFERRRVRIGREAEHLPPGMVCNTLNLGQVCVKALHPQLAHPNLSQLSVEMSPTRWPEFDGGRLDSGLIGKRVGQGVCFHPCHFECPY